MAGDIRLTGSAELQALARDFRAAGEAGKGLRRELRDGLKGAARPIQDDMKSALRNMPAKGPKTSGLRKRMAKAVKTRVRMSGATASVKVEVDSKSLERYGQQRLPKLLDDDSFRHPVYGHRNRKWAVQRGHPYSREIRARHQNAAHDAAIAAIDAVAAKIERG